MLIRCNKLIFSCHVLLQKVLEDEDASDRRKRQAGAPFGRKTYKRPPTNPPPHRSYPAQGPAYRNPLYPNFNRPLPSERGKYRGPPTQYRNQYQGSPQYSSQPQYRGSPRFSSPPQYRSSDYYDESPTANDDEDGGDAYYTLENHFAPEYENNGGLIVGEDTDAEAQEQEQEQEIESEEEEGPGKNY